MVVKSAFFVFLLARVSVLLPYGRAPAMIFWYYKSEAGSASYGVRFATVPSAPATPPYACLTRYSVHTPNQLLTHNKCIFHSLKTSIFMKIQHPQGMSFSDFSFSNSEWGNMKRGGRGKKDKDGASLLFIYGITKLF